MSYRWWPQRALDTYLMARTADISRLTAARIAVRTVLLVWGAELRRMKFQMFGGKR